MKFHIDIFAAETEDETEWQLSGWAFVPEDSIWNGRLEVDGKSAGPVSYGWPRPDVLAAFPSLCPSAQVGLRTQVFLPPGLASGDHLLELVFFNRAGVELDRAEQSFSTTRAIASHPSPVSTPRTDKQHPQSGYLDLLEKSLIGLPYAQGFEFFLRQEGRDWPAHAHSMIGQVRMLHLRACAETALLENVPGDFIETGVWRGGACIMLRGVLQAYGELRRKVWLVDSFAGLPKPNEEKYPADTGDNLHQCAELAVSLEQVQENFKHYGLLDGQLEFLKGWFSQTLPTAGISQIAVLRLDGDMYESTMDVLTHLYPKLSPGGFCIIDDYGAIPACRQAVRDYRAAHNIHEPITMIDWTGSFWRKAYGDSRALETNFSAVAANTNFGENSMMMPSPPLWTDSIKSALAAPLPGHPNVAWTEHIPFAFWLVDQLQPRTIVELGVHSGGSYRAFCQAVEQSGLDTRCYGVDTFEGDVQAGFYETTVLQELRAFHDSRYGNFSELIQSDFSKAVARFEDGSIDLLHIDGLHLYESVKHDFETWLPKMSEKGVILFHDTRVFDREFGVHRLWDELQAKYPSFEFYHCHGLGVLAPGRNIPGGIFQMLFADDGRKADLRRFFSLLGSRLTLQKEAARTRNFEEEIANLRIKKHALEAQQILFQQCYMELVEKFEKTQAEYLSLQKEQDSIRNQGFSHAPLPSLSNVERQPRV